MPMYIVYGLLAGLILLLVILFVKVFITHGWMEKDEEKKQLVEEMKELIKLENEGVEFIPCKNDYIMNVSSDLSDLDKHTVNDLLKKFKKYMDKDKILN